MALLKPIKTRVETRWLTLTLPGEVPLEVEVRRRKGVRKLTLRYRPQQKNALLTLPLRVAMCEAERFLYERREWLQRQVMAAPEPIMLRSGMSFPLLGQEHQLIHLPVSRGAMSVQDGVVTIHGAEEFFSRRLQDGLKKALKKEIESRVIEKVAQLPQERRVRRIRVLDTSSQWGSCTAEGVLSFSWRLVFAPEAVLDYLVSHEVAHLIEMNHSEAYWQVVSGLCPDYPTHQRWLKKNGPQLFRYEA